MTWQTTSGIPATSSLNGTESAATRNCEWYCCSAGVGDQEVNIVSRLAALCEQIRPQPSRGVAQEDEIAGVVALDPLRGQLVRVGLGTEAAGVEHHAQLAGVGGEAIAEILGDVTQRLTFQHLGKQVPEGANPAAKARRFDRVGP